MKVSVLASGSKGNVTYLEIGNKKFLLDAGKNYKYINEELKKQNINPLEIDYIVISHNHDDHISALKTLISKTKASVIISEKMLYEIDDLKQYPHIIVCEDEIEIDGIKIISYRSSHDAIDSRNFVFEFDNKKIGYITDTGYINKKYFPILKNLDIYLFESNHDIQLLQDGPYKPWLKRRVLSDYGHLSNKLASFYLAKLIGENTKKIILIHLSETNNLEEIAMETINNTFIDYEIDFKSIVCARQNEATELIEI
ncbi:MAG: MBL fold metallo-hydrolase [Firmicutes bacterium]|nr:MBL fold metallo-hydrolase [Bacillota bacterium]